LIGIKNI